MLGSTLRRTSVVAGSTIAALALGTTAATAHHCYVPMYSLNGPVSENWQAFSAEDGATMFAGYSEPCAGATDAGYAALRAEGMPVGIKMFAKMTIGDPKGTEEDFRIPTQRGADGKGLKYFGAGSTLADDMIGTFLAGAYGSCA